MDNSGQPRRHINLPDFSREMACAHPVAGVDEAGRGSLAGPVVSAAVILDCGNIPAGLNDSKKLPEARRVFLFLQILASAQIGIGVAEPVEIDTCNILTATHRTMQRAVAGLECKPATVLVDGNLCPDFGIPAQPLIRGDSKSLSIAAASIIAKVTRDRIMAEMDTRFPGYGFARHKGYPTKAHKRVLSSLGPCPIHRRSYKPVRMLAGMNEKLKTR